MDGATVVSKTTQMMMMIFKLNNFRWKNNRLTKNHVATYILGMYTYVGILVHRYSRVGTYNNSRMPKDGFAEQ